MNASILVVDGAPEIRETISAALTRKGCSVICAGSGEAALKALWSRSFDMVITDIRLPDMAGPEYLERIREMDEHIEIIVLTGFNTLQNVIKALRDLEAADYLSKPLNDMDELVGAVEKGLQKRNLRKKLVNLERKVKCHMRGLEVEIDYLKRKLKSL